MRDPMAKPAASSDALLIRWPVDNRSIVVFIERSFRVSVLSDRSIRVSVYDCHFSSLSVCAALRDTAPVLLQLQSKKHKVCQKKNS